MHQQHATITAIGHDADADARVPGAGVVVMAAGGFGFSADRTPAGPAPT